MVSTMPENARIRGWQGIPGVIGSYRSGGLVVMQRNVNSASHTVDDETNVKRIQLTDLIEWQSGTGADITPTSTPTINVGSPGQRLTIVNVDSAHNLILRDRGTLASSGLFLTGTSITIAPRNTLSLIYSSTVGGWVQISPLIATL